MVCMICASRNEMIRSVATVASKICWASVRAVGALVALAVMQYRQLPAALFQSLQCV